jgi:hypothetical protein
MLRGALVRSKAGAKPVQSRCNPGGERHCTGLARGLEREWMPPSAVPQGAINRLISAEA